MRAAEVCQAPAELLRPAHQPQPDQARAQRRAHATRAVLASPRVPTSAQPAGRSRGAASAAHSGSTGDPDPRRALGRRPGRDLPPPPPRPPPRPGPRRRPPRRGLPRLPPRARHQAPADLPRPPEAHRQRRPLHSEGPGRCPGERAARALTAAQGYARLRSRREQWVCWGRIEPQHACCGWLAPCRREQLAPRHEWILRSRVALQRTVGVASFAFLCRLDLGRDSHRARADRQRRERRVRSRDRTGDCACSFLQGQGALDRRVGKWRD